MATGECDLNGLCLLKPLVALRLRRGDAGLPKVLHHGIEYLDGVEVLQRELSVDIHPFPLDVTLQMNGAGHVLAVRKCSVNSRLQALALVANDHQISDGVVSQTRLLKKREEQSPRIISLG